MAQGLKLLMFQLRRTDAEFRRITDNKSMKEFETDILRIMTLVRSLVFMYQAALILEAALDPTGISAGKAAFAIGMIGLSGATSATVMSELS